MTIESVDHALEVTRGRWGALSSVAVWLLAVISTFVLPPPLHDAANWRTFTTFIVAALVGLFIVAGHTVRRRCAKRTWMRVSLASILLAAISFFVYEYLLDNWTMPYNDYRLVVGSTRTPGTQAYVSRAGRELSDQELLEHSVGRTLDVWVGREILNRRFTLAALYVTSICLFAILAMSVVQLTLQTFPAPKTARKPSSSSVQDPATTGDPPSRGTLKCESGTSAS